MPEVSKQGPAIDFFYLTNAKQAITKDELYRVLPSQNYNEYINKYIEKKISTFFVHNFDKIWFIDRYLSSLEVKKDSVFADLQFFIKENGCQYSYDKHFVIKEDSKIIKFNLRQNAVNRAKFDDLTRNIICITKNLTQNERIQEYSRSGLFLVDDVHLDETSLALKELFNEECEVFNISTVPIKRTIIKLNHEDLAVLEKYIDYFNNKNRTNYKKGSDENNIIYNTLLLRFVFNFCIFCCIEFDSILDMCLNCGMYHEPSEYNNKDERIIFDRNNILFFTQFNISSLFNWETEIKRVFIRREVLTCSICKKDFFKDSDSIKHIKEEHVSEAAIISKFCDDYLLFSKNIDPFVVREILGLRNELPFFMNNESIKGVKYDFRRVFSGNF
ncbi:Zinc finger C2H2 protein [Cucumispora dikerogammari]|nr:Zinc finger C2H2 protein [Cucumispora dikerogammari]